MSNVIDIQDYYSCVLMAKTCIATRREIHLVRMIYNYRLSVLMEPQGMYYDEQYCFEHFPLALAAFLHWDGETEVQGHVKRVGDS